MTQACFEYQIKNLLCLRVSTRIFFFEQFNSLQNALDAKLNYIEYNQDNYTLKPKKKKQISLKKTLLRIKTVQFSLTETVSAVNVNRVSVRRCVSSLTTAEPY